MRELAASLVTLKVSVFTLSGGLVWRSPAWGCGSSSVSMQEIGSYRWHEFVYHEDLPELLAWFHDAAESTYSFRCYNPGRGCWQRCWLHKLRCEAGWLCVGDNEDIPTPVGGEWRSGGSLDSCLLGLAMMLATSGGGGSLCDLVSAI